MIDNISLAEWRDSHAPWPVDAYVEQDLVISRALVNLYSHPLLQKELAFRGGTALQKCFYKSPTRYSEDIDCVQINATPIGPILDALRESLESWLGRPKLKQGQGLVTLYYKFESLGPPTSFMRLKVEINTREHTNYFNHIHKSFAVTSRWFSGQCEILTFELDELLGSKLRALYQRKKGRDLFDIARALESLPINIERMVYCFQKYVELMGLKISRAEFESNLLNKRNSSQFREDMQTLLPVDIKLNFDDDFNLVMQQVIAKLPGESWKGTTR